MNGRIIILLNFVNQTVRNKLLFNLQTKSAKISNDFAQLAVFLLSLSFYDKTTLDINWIGDNINQYTTIQTWSIGRSIVNVNDSMKLRGTFLKHVLDKELDNMELPPREDELVQAIFRVEVRDEMLVNSEINH